MSKEAVTQEMIDAVEKSLEQAVETHRKASIAKVESLEEKFQELRQDIGTRGSPGHIGDQHGAGQIIKAVTGSDGFEAAKSGRHSGAIDLGRLSAKSLTSLQGSTGSPAEGIDVLPMEQAGLYGWARRPLRLLDMLRSIPVDSNSVQWTRLSGYSNAAAAQAGEGADKAEQTVTPELVKADISTIAHFIVVSRQVLDDAGWLASEIDRLMRFNLIDKLEADLINGDGTNFAIDGLDNQATADAGASGKEAPDQIGEWMADMESDGYAPDFILVNPTDFQTWRSERATSGDNQYVSGSWAQPAPPVMWNVPAVKSSSQTSGEVIAVHSPSAALLDRQTPTIEMFAQDSDNVRKNLLTIRAELRAGLAVFDTAGVRKLTIT